MNKNLNHLHSLNTTTTNHPLKSTTTMNPHQFNGLNITKYQVSIFTHMNHQLNHINKFQNHLHINNTTTMNHQLNHITHIPHSQLNGRHTTTSHLPLSTTMNLLLSHTSKNGLLPHMLIITPTTNKLESTNHTKQHHTSGLISMKNHQLNSTIMNLQLNNIPLNTNHLHLLSTTTTSHQLKAT